MKIKPIPNLTRIRIVIRDFDSKAGYMSRSEARRVIEGLEKFKTIIFDFKGVSFIGQGFADEIFRVWQNRHPKIKIESVNAGENVRFMINHVLG